MKPSRAWTAVLCLAVLAGLSGAAGTEGFRENSAVSSEKGRLSVYFRDEMVGFEDYVWSEDDFGYTLEVIGRMTKPLDLDVERLTIHLNKSFIAYSYIFKGSIGGLRQEVTSHLSEGRVTHILTFAGQETRLEAQVRRDAFLLPNPLFSPYVVLTKKFRCGQTEKADCAAYIIPQMEVPLRVEPVEGAPCRLALAMAGVQVEVETDADGNLLSLLIPSQNLKVTKNSGQLDRDSLKPLE